MTTSSEKYLVSPYGEAQFPYLNQPDDRFPGKEKYKVNLVLDPETPEHAKFLGELERLAKAEVGDDAQLPIKDHKDRDKNSTGLKVVKFSSTVPTKLYDRNNVPLEARVGMGSTIQVSAKPNFYRGIGGRSGMNLYLSAVKVRELVDPAPSTPEAFGFDPAEFDESEVDPQTGDELSVEEATPFEEELPVFGEATEKLPF